MTTIKQLQKQLKDIKSELVQRNYNFADWQVRQLTRKADEIECELADRQLKKKRKYNDLVVIDHNVYTTTKVKRYVVMESGYSEPWLNDCETEQQAHDFAEQYNLDFQKDNRFFYVMAVC